MNHASRSPNVANVNPKPILDMNYAFAQTAMLMAAVRLHIFTYLANDPLTAATLAALVKYDLILVAHVCRFIGEKHSRVLFDELFQSLRPDGTLAVADVLLSDDRASPPFAVTLDLSMLVNTRYDQIFTFQDFSTWLNDSGFQEVHRLDVAAPSPVIIALKGEKRL